MRPSLLVVLVVLLVPSSAAATDGWSYGGFTSQRYAGTTPYPFSYDALLGRARVSVNLECSDGERRQDIYLDVGDLPRDRPGVFVEPLEDGGTSTLEVSFTRERRGLALTGDLRLRRTQRDAGGAVVDTCDTGPVRYSARDDVFGGNSDAFTAGTPFPFSARLTRGALRSVTFSWSTRRCPRAGGGEGFLAAPTRIRRIPLKRYGSFDHRGSTRLTSPNGRTLVVRHHLAGTVRKLAGRRLLSGVVEVSADFLAADGSFILRNCETGLIPVQADR